MHGRTSIQILTVSQLAMTWWGGGCLKDTTDHRLCFIRYRMTEPRKWPNYISSSQPGVSGGDDHCPLWNEKQESLNSQVSPTTITWPKMSTEWVKSHVTQPMQDAPQSKLLNKSYKSVQNTAHGTWLLWMAWHSPAQQKDMERLLEVHSTWWHRMLLFQFLLFPRSLSSSGMNWPSSETVGHRGP